MEPPAAGAEDAVGEADAAADVPLEGVLPAADVPAEPDDPPHAASSAAVAAAAAVQPAACRRLAPV
jgi:hypothetical protein